MIFVIMNYGVTRNQSGRDWKAKALVFGLAATIAGAMTGLALGLAGLAVPDAARLPLVGTLAIVGIGIGCIVLIGGAVNVPQRNCETAQLWMNTGALAGSALNGAALGAGFVTRVGYWVWYVVPVAALLAGPLPGLVIFGIYGLVRGAAPTVAILQMLARKRCDQKDITRVQEWLFRQSARARTAAHVTLVVISVLAATVVLS